MLVQPPKCPSPATRHPLSKLRDPTADCRFESKRLIGFTARSFSLGPREPGSWSVLSNRAGGTRSEYRGHPLLGFRSSSGSVRTSPQHRQRPRDPLRPVLSLSWASAPYSDRQSKGAASPGDSQPPARCVFRVSSSLDAFFPFTPSDPFGSGRSWDSPFRALLRPAPRCALSDDRALLMLPSRRRGASKPRAADPVPVEVHDASRFPG